MVRGGQHFAMGPAPSQDMGQPGEPNGYSRTNHTESKAVNIMRLSPESEETGPEKCRI